MPAHALTNFEIQKHYQSEPRFNSVYSRDNLMSVDLIVFILEIIYLK